ncbi:MAG: Na+/H+ antiporter NhaA [Actinomycetota bacterium]
MGSQRLDEQSVGVRRLATPLRDFLATENSSAVVLLAATIAALVWANSPWSESYEGLWTTPLSIGFGSSELSLDLRHWVNDGLMAFFFFVVGLEIRREFDMGELRERRRIATPVLAAIGGMIVPAAIYLAFNAGEPSARGWGIAMGTDTAFALGILTLVSGASMPRLRIFLLTLVIVDDIAALSVIALVYTENLSVSALLVALALFGVVLLMRRAGIRNGAAYFLVGLGVWIAMLASGVHPTIAGVALGLLATAYPPTRERLQDAGALWRLFREEPTPEYARSASRSVALAISPNERLQYLFHPWTSYVIVPLFALANAGLVINGEVLGHTVSSPVTLGIVVALVIGKPVGIMGVTWLVTRRRFGGLPLSVPWTQLVGAATVAGIGFTVALLIADISLEGQVLEDAKLGIMAASVLASGLAWIVFRVIGRLPSRLRSVDEDRVAEPIQDLADPVDDEVDHVRGPGDAPLTLLEYGDFECPHCGRAEPVVRNLLQRFGAEIRFVFRHLPLTDVHENAELAAEAAEAAGAQGRFWEMHDLLFAHQDALRLTDVRGYARDLGLDVDQVSAELGSRRHTLRVARDVESADVSGVAGTPTFFVNGRRHYGAYDEATLLQLLREALAETRARARPSLIARAGGTDTHAIWNDRFARPR